jgi:hypothetical protein
MYLTTIKRNVFSTTALFKLVLPTELPTSAEWLTLIFFRSHSILLDTFNIFQYSLEATQNE